MTVINFDYSALTGYYNARINLNLASQQASSPTAFASAEGSDGVASGDDLPWRQEIDPADALRTALGATSFLPQSVIREATSERGDVPRLLAAYEALASVTAIARSALDGDLPAGQETRSERRLLEGVAEVRAFLESQDIEKTVLITGDRLSTAQSDVAIQRNSYAYETKVLHDGEFDAEVAAFTGDKASTVTAKKPIRPKPSQLTYRNWKPLRGRLSVIWITLLNSSISSLRKLA